jgi:hypothetical protein
MPPLEGLAAQLGNGLKDIDRACPPSNAYGVEFTPNDARERKPDGCFRRDDSSAVVVIDASRKARLTLSPIAM